MFFFRTPQSAWDQSSQMIFRFVVLDILFAVEAFDRNFLPFHDELLIGLLITAAGVTMTPSPGIVIPSRALMFQCRVSALSFVVGFPTSRVP